MLKVLIPVKVLLPPVNTSPAVAGVSKVKFPRPSVVSTWPSTPSAVGNLYSSLNLTAPVPPGASSRLLEPEVVIFVEEPDNVIVPSPNISKTSTGKSLAAFGSYKSFDTANIFSASSLFLVPTLTAGILVEPLATK